LHVAVAFDDFAPEFAVAAAAVDFLAIMPPSTVTVMWGK
jgi:hypothetical protein